MGWEARLTPPSPRPAAGRDEQTERRARPPSSPLAVAGWVWGSAVAGTPTSSLSGDLC